MVCGELEESFVVFFSLETFLYYLVELLWINDFNNFFAGPHNPLYLCTMFWPVKRRH